MNLDTAPYPAQKATWPKAGRHIMAQYDDEILSVTDISAFVAEQRAHVQAGHLGGLNVPVERPFVPADVATRMRLRLDSTRS